MPADDPEQSREALPIETLLTLLRPDFPELVKTAEGVLQDRRYKPAQAEQFVRAMICAEASVPDNDALNPMRRYLKQAADHDESLEVWLAIAAGAVG